MPAALAALRRAAIVAVGSELLETARLDTNSLFITQQLNAAGIDVVFKSVAGDDRAVLGNVLRFALASADLVVVSGGLGPTDDDVTREAVAEVLGRPLRESAALVDYLQRRYASRGFTAPMPRNNLRQAMVPEGGEVLENPHGSAPGLWIDHDGRVVVLLPGPPRELKPMMTALSARFAARSSRARHRAAQSPHRRPDRIPGGPDAAAALPRVGRLVATGGRYDPRQAWTDRSPPVGPPRLAPPMAAAMLERATAQVVGVLGDVVFSTDGRRLEEVVGELLSARGLGWRRRSPAPADC